MPRNEVSNQRRVLPLIGRICKLADTRMPSALREQLLAQVQNNNLPLHRPEHQLSTAVNSNHHNIDPAIASAGVMNAGAGDSGGDENGSDGRKSGKRELSTSKRAAQNRAAQVCNCHLLAIRMLLLHGAGGEMLSAAWGIDGLLNDYCSGPLGNAKKVISKPSRTKSGNSIISTRTLSLCNPRTISYATT